MVIINLIICIIVVIVVLLFLNNTKSIYMKLNLIVIVFITIFTQLFIYLMSSRKLTFIQYFSDRDNSWSIIISIILGIVTGIIATILFENVQSKIEDRREYLNLVRQIIFQCKSIVNKFESFFIYEDLRITLAEEIIESVNNLQVSIEEIQYYDIKLDKVTINIHNLFKRLKSKDNNIIYSSMYDSIFDMDSMIIDIDLITKRIRDIVKIFRYSIYCDKCDKLNRKGNDINIQCYFTKSNEIDKCNIIDNFKNGYKEILYKNGQFKVEYELIEKYSAYIASIELFKVNKISNILRYSGIKVIKLEAKKSTVSIFDFEKELKGQGFKVNRENIDFNDVNFYDSEDPLNEVRYRVSKGKDTTIIKLYNFNSKLLSDLAKENYNILKKDMKIIFKEKEYTIDFLELGFVAICEENSALNGKIINKFKKYIYRN